MKLFFLVLLMYWGATSFAHAHDVWANGQPVPSWVKESCCGPSDAHHLTQEQVHGPTKGANGVLYYTVDGYPDPVAASSALPSQDGDYWIFYTTGVDMSGKRYWGQVYCFFIPVAL